MTTQLLNDRYQVIQVLGAGGFGETFLAEDTYMPSKRRCVVKQLRPIQNNPQIYQLVQERFQREAAILEALGGASDQIPALYAYFCAEGEFYLVQEWVEGDTLTAKIHKQGLFIENTVRELLLNLLPVLDYVHSQRIVHRDIKPDNIIIRHRDSKPVLIDFGAVRESMGTVVNSQGSPTSSIVIGTPGYMPSEQAAGRPVYSSDLYSLGMTAIYLLTGRQPQQLETDPQTGEVVWQHYASHINPILLEILSKSIAYHPRDRYPTAKAMLDALQSITNPQILTASPTIAPTVATVPQQDIANSIPATQPPTPTPAPIPATIPLAPAAINQNNQPKNNNQNSVLIGSLIAGGLIGASVIISQVITKTPQPVTNSSPSQTSGISKSINSQSSQNNTQISKTVEIPTTTQSQRQDIPNITQNIEPQTNEQPPIQNEQNISQNSQSQLNPQIQQPEVSTTVQTGEPQTNNTPETSTQAPPTAQDTSVNNYAWLSERLVTDADLDGKSGYELDIMRNSIFAAHGRLFETPGLQEYFNQQSWYSPKYSAKEFPKKLLSKIERENVDYIAKYQDRNDLRYFKK
ncbi:MAG TPA: YARHG domain-containing protein [Nostocaceae cyanobacterium]|nr:YARHG domain-containing protein [Nostocaceae cyanobacterium]